MPREGVVDTREEKNEETLMSEAKERFNFALSYWSEFHTAMKNDLDFIHVTQWTQAATSKRTKEGRPMLEIDRVSTNIDSVIGDNRMNKAAAKVRPADRQATKKTADVMNGLMRAIQRNSDAEVAYETGFETVVQGGFGAWRVDKVFADDESFEQDLEVNEISDPFSVLFDPAFKKSDATDARYCFVTEKMSRDEFRVRYPGIEPVSFGGPTVHETDWCNEDFVVVAEYWVKRPVEKRVALLTDGTTTDLDLFEKIQDELAASGNQLAVATGTDGKPRVRNVKTHEVVMYFVDGNQIIEGPTVWEGKTIPIVGCFGKKMTVHGKKRYRGLVRKAKDSQRSYNFARSSSTESMGNSPKAPIMATAKQLEGHEQSWIAAINSNLPFLKYNADRDAPGAPQRIQPPNVNTAAVNEALQSSDDIKATMGIFDPSIGAQAPETSGVAIARRQLGSDKTNFVYHDNLARAIEVTGEIMVEMIPLVYDSTRAVVILHEDDQEEIVDINTQITDEESGELVTLHDLSAGKYSLSITVGPSFATQREEALDSMLKVIEAAPQVAMLVIDLIAKAGNWPDSEEFIARLRKALPPGIAEPTEEEKEAARTAAEAQANQPPGPEEIAQDLTLKKLDAEVKGAEFDSQKTQAEIAKILAQIQKTQAEVTKTMSEAAVNQVFEAIGMTGQQEGQPPQL